MMACSLTDNYQNSGGTVPLLCFFCLPSTSCLFNECHYFSYSLCPLMGQYSYTILLIPIGSPRAEVLVLHFPIPTLHPLPRSDAWPTHLPWRWKHQVPRKGWKWSIYSQSKITLRAVIRVLWVGNLMEDESLVLKRTRTLWFLFHYILKIVSSNNLMKTWQDMSLSDDDTISMVF